MLYWGAHRVDNDSFYALYVVLDGWKVEISQMVHLSKHSIQGISVQNEVGLKSEVGVCRQRWGISNQRWGSGDPRDPPPNLTPGEYYSLMVPNWLMHYLRPYLLWHNPSKSSQFYHIAQPSTVHFVPVKIAPSISTITIGRCGPISIVLSPSDNKWLFLY